VPLLAGFALWAALTLFGLFSSWALCAALLRDRGLLERWQATLLVFFATLLTAVQALGLVRAIGRVQLALLGAALFGAELAVAVRRGVVLPWSDLRAPLDLLREAWTEREPAFLGLLAALIPLGTAAAMIWFLPTWHWDPIWYHVTITNHAIQDGGMAWDLIGASQAAGFARGLELISVWNVLLPRDLKFDDAAQYPFAFLGLLALAGWLRRLGANRPLAAGLSSLWALVPAFFLLLPSTHVDVASAALLLTGWVWATGPRFGAAERWMSVGALALYAAIKFTGLFHLGLVAPLLLGRGIAGGFRRSDGALIAAALWIASPIYAHNSIVHGNPIWPVRTSLFGWRLGGDFDASREWSQPFFLDKGSLVAALKSWYDPYPMLWPDVRGGGLGPMFRWLGLPATGIVGVAGIVRRRLQWLGIAGLFLLAIVVPAAWWPRFILAASAASLAALCVILLWVPWRWPRRAMSAGVVAVSLVGLTQGFPGLGPQNDPELRARFWRASHAERWALQPVEWMWPAAAARQREALLKPGDVITHDASVCFPGELWTRDLRNKVFYVQHLLDDEPEHATGLADPDAEFLARLRRAGATWAAVRTGGHGESALQRIGATRLFTVRNCQATSMYRLPP
jgi:hypothetical protein